MRKENYIHNGRRRRTNKQQTTNNKTTTMTARETMLEAYRERLHIVGAKVEFSEVSDEAVEQDGSQLDVRLTVFLGEMERTTDLVAAA
jgi:hypothetical protein